MLGVGEWLALDGAGGWQDRTTVEDMDLAVRATLKGWKFLYLGSIKVKNELPSNFKAYRYQQHRWSCGPANLFRKMVLEIIRNKKVTLWKKLYVIYSFFFVRKIVAHIVTFILYCVVLPMAMMVPEVAIPKWGVVLIPIIITLLNSVGTPRSFYLVVIWILFENVMSLHRTKATFIGLFETGRVNEWVVTEKLGNASKGTSKPLITHRFKIGERPPSAVDHISAVASTVIDHISAVRRRLTSTISSSSRIGYARVLVEVNAKKGIVDSIDVLYMNKENSEKHVKKVRVEYDWKPPLCPKCEVFGHTNNNCAKRVTKGGKDNVKENEEGKVNEEFVKKNKNDEVQNEGMRKKTNEEKFVTPTMKQQKAWNVNENVINDIRSTANKFAILQEVEEGSLNMKLNEQEKVEVGRYVMMKLQPSYSATSKWSKVMKEYFKEKWDKEYSYEVQNENDIQETVIELDENDVYIDKNGTASFMNENEVSWNIRGLGNVTKQNEIKKLIRNERLSMCAVLETHMKKNRIDKVCMNIFGSWVWQNNVGYSSKGCRIVVGWDTNNVISTLINATAQSMLYKVEVISSKNIVYCTFIYAANKGKDRRDLWKELNLNKRLIGDSAWVIMGDVNVSLNLEDHSEGISNFSQDMIEFQECVNEIEIEDINSTGMHFT
ncbi:nucleotide-diphospho-sugar transferase [Tanacetum coccineum]